MVWGLRSLTTSQWLSWFRSLALLVPASSCIFLVQPKQPSALFLQFDMPFLGGQPSVPQFPLS